MDDLLLLAERRDPAAATWCTAESWRETFGQDPWLVPVEPLAAEAGLARVLFGDDDCGPLVPVRGLPTDSSAEVVGLLKRAGARAEHTTYLTLDEVLRGDWTRIRTGDTVAVPVRVFAEWESRNDGTSGEPEDWRGSPPADSAIVAAEDASVALRRVEASLAPDDLRNDLRHDRRAAILRRVLAARIAEGSLPVEQPASPQAPVYVRAHWHSPSHLLAQGFWSASVPILLRLAANTGGAASMRITCCRHLAVPPPQPPGRA